MNGERYSLRGAVTINPANATKESGANSDGSLYVTVAAAVPSAEATLSNSCGLNVSELLKCSGGINVVVDFIDTKQQFYFTNAVIVGTPQLNSESGEISGLRWTSPNFRQISY
jgi:hypothetical protein